MSYGPLYLALLYTGHANDFSEVAPLGYLRSQQIKREFSFQTHVSCAGIVFPLLETA